MRSGSQEDRKSKGAGSQTVQEVKWSGSQEFQELKRSESQRVRKSGGYEVKSSRVQNVRRLIV